MERFVDLKIVSTNALWIVAEILLVFAVLGEWKATTNSTGNSKAALAAVAQIPVGSTGFCNTVARAAQLSQRQNNADTIQWRKAIIAGFAVVILAQVFIKSHHFTSVKKLTLVLIVFLVYTSVAGYSDYHLTQVSNTAVVDILRLAISRFDPATCDPALIGTLY